MKCAVARRGGIATARGSREVGSYHTRGVQPLVQCVTGTRICVGSKHRVLKERLLLARHMALRSPPRPDPKSKGAESRRNRIHPKVTRLLQIPNDTTVSR